jgi:2'-5' RNA ligase
MATNVSNSRDGSVRLFLAVDVPPAVRSQIIPAIHQLEPFRGSLKLVSPDAVHVTVKFLGPTASPRISAISRAASDAAGATPGFSLTLGGFGTFPAKSSALRVVWLGISRDSGYSELQRLFTRVEDYLVPLGVPRESRPFAPHLTLARVREGRRGEELQEIAGAVSALNERMWGDLSFTVSRLTLFRSDLSPSGPRYTVVTESPMRQAS